MFDDNPYAPPKALIGELATPSNPSDMAQAEPMSGACCISHPSLPSCPSVRNLFAPGKTSLEIPSASVTSWKLNNSPSGAFSNFPNLNNRDLRTGRTSWCRF